MLLKGGKVFFQGNFSLKDILIAKGIIQKVGEPGSLPKQAETIDCKGLHVLPGAIDSHVHFRVPGAEKKEDWQSGSRAALHGGVTTVLDMPNNTPAITSVEALERKRELVKGQSYVNYGFHFGASLDNLEEIGKAKGFAGVKLFMGSSTGDLLVDDERVMGEVFALAKALGKPVCVHGEDEEIIRENTNQARAEGWDDDPITLHARIRSGLAEVKAFETALRLQEAKGNRLHFLHLSTADALDVLRESKRPGVTCEVSPHHLFLFSFAAQSDGGLEGLGNFGKMNPPLRSKPDEEALLNGLNEGVIDFVATDHAPHLKAEKEVDYWSAPSGVPGIETMLPLLLNAANEGRLPLELIPRITSENPAKAYGLKERGLIKEGFAADLTIVSLEEEWLVEGAFLQTKCEWSPFEGARLKGKVKKVIVNGQLAFDDGEFNEVRGKEVKFEGE